ncbi:hypothetical protein AB3N59_04450 [Leptospira sp. WS92.C1]
MDPILELLNNRATPIFVYRSLEECNRDQRAEATGIAIIYSGTKDHVIEIAKRQIHHMFPMGISPGILTAVVIRPLEIPFGSLPQYPNQPEDRKNFTGGMALLQGNCIIPRNTAMVPEDALDTTLSATWFPNSSVLTQKLGDVIYYYENPFNASIIQERFLIRAASNGPFPSNSARIDDHEFFADLTACYFGYFVDHAPMCDGTNKDWLKTNMPEEFELLQRIYAGR